MKHLICHVTSESHVIEGSSNIMSGSILSGLVVRYCNSRDMMFLVCHMIKQDHVIERSSGYNDRGLSR